MAKKKYKVLVGVDFSPSSAFALQSARSVMGRRPDQLYALHVIDRDFIQKCIGNRLGTEAEIKKTLFLEAKSKLQAFLANTGLSGDPVEPVIREGIPFLEINKQAIEKDVDIIVLGTQGTSGDMERIFFGSTTERVLRFIKRPVLCVPMEEERKP